MQRGYPEMQAGDPLGGDPSLTSLHLSPNSFIKIPSFLTFRLRLRRAAQYRDLEGISVGLPDRRPFPPTPRSETGRR